MAIKKDHAIRLVSDTLTRFASYLAEQGVILRTSIDDDRAVWMILATAAHESHLFTYPYQIGGGPARGLCGMEISEGNVVGTEESIWTSWLEYRPEWRTALTRTCGVIGYCSNDDALVYNLAYQIIMARIYYWQVPEPLPGPYMLHKQCQYWAKYWKRTDVSTGDEGDFLRDYLHFLG